MSDLLDILINEKEETLNEATKMMGFKFPMEFKMESGDYHDFNEVKKHMKVYLKKKALYLEIEEEDFDELEVPEINTPVSGGGYYAHFKLK